MINIFLLLALIVFIMFSYYRPLWGLGVIIVLLPSYLFRLELLFLPTTFLELMIISLFVVWLAKDKMYSKINFSFDKSKSYNALSIPLQYLVSLWLIIGLIAVLTNFTWSALGLWRAYFLEPVMFFLVFVYTVRTKKDFKFILICSMALLVWLFEIAMYQNFTDWNHVLAYTAPNIKRLTGPFSYPNALSLLTAPLTALFAGLWIYSKDKLKDVHFFILAIMGLALSVLAVSEGAVVAIFFSLFLALILAKKWYKYGIAIIVTLGLGTLFIASTFNYNPQLNLQSSSLDIRLNQWQETHKLLSDNFILGAGINGYQNALEKYHQTEWLEVYLYPHNIFLNFWTELGFFGVLVFIALMIYVVYLLIEIFKRSHKWGWSLAMMWLTWFVHGLVDVPYFKNDLAVLFFIMLAITYLVFKDKHDVKA